MPQLLPTSRAARLAGVSRGELQARIRSGELQTFEGQIAVTELLRVYPEAQLEDNSAIARVELIKANAKPKYRDESGDLPSSEVILSRFKKISEVLIQTKSERDRFKRLLLEVVERLGRVCQGGEGEGVAARETAAGLERWLKESMLAMDALSMGSANVFVKDAFLRVLAAQVKVIPSGHEFFVEGQDSVLDAAIRAGLYVNYGCSKGNCGACKARVISGEVQRIQEHDYILSEQERGMGYMLMCSNTAVTDLVIEAGEAASSHDIPVQEIRAMARKAERLAPDLILLDIQTPKTRTLRFMAGQSIRLAWDDEAPVAYPVASCPCDGRNLQILIRAKPGDDFAVRLFEGVELPRALTLTGPEGDFVLDKASIRPLLFLAIDDGFAPIRSLVEHAIAIDEVPSIGLYRLITGGGEPYLEGVCRAWNDSLDNFEYQRLTAQGDPLSELDKVLADHRDLSGYDVYIAGPATLAESAAQKLAGQGLPSAQIHLSTALP